MIFDRLDNISRYTGLSRNFCTAIEFLKKTDLSALPLGRVEIDGDNVYALMQENILKDSMQAKFEAHDIYSDIQLVLSDRELMMLGTKGKVLEKTGEDFRVCEVEEVLRLEMEAGDFVIFYPGEMHAPGLGEPNWEKKCRKIVVKVKM